MPALENSQLSKLRLNTNLMTKFSVCQLRFREMIQSTSIFYYKLFPYHRIQSLKWTNSSCMPLGTLYMFYVCLLQVLLSKMYFQLRNSTCSIRIMLKVTVCIDIKFKKSWAFPADLGQGLATNLSSGAPIPIAEENSTVSNNS